MQRSNWNQIGSPTTSSNCVTTSTTNQQRLWPSGFPRHQPAMVAPHPPPAARHRVAGRPGRRGRSAGAVAQPGDRRQRWPQSSSSEDLAHGGHGQRLKLNFVEVGSNMVPRVPKKTQVKVQNDAPTVGEHIAVRQAQYRFEPDFPYYHRTVHHESCWK